MGEIRICLQVCVAFVIAAVVVTRKHRAEVDLTCPGPLAYYVDLGCTPIYKNGKDHCPASFDCEHIKKRSKNMCYINGHVYRSSQFLNEEDSNVCDFICVCTSKYNHVEIAAFKCMEHIKCKKVVAKPGCYLRKNPAKCCKDPKEICPKILEERAICNVSGIEYLDGEYFEVDGEPDLTCICRPGYEGKNILPFCSKSNHSPCHHPAFSHRDHFRQNCAPVFLDKAIMNRCYIKMRCQNSDDSIVSSQIPFEMDNDWNNMCKFGNWIMQIGDKLGATPLDGCIECICEVPPVLTCKYLPEEQCNHTLLR